MFTLKSSLANSPEGIEKDVDNIENIPVYTMKKDIEKAKNPQILPGGTINRPLNSPRILNGSQESSPFFGSQYREQARSAEKASPADTFRFSGARDVPAPINSTKSFPGQKTVLQREDLRLKETLGEPRTAWRKIIFIAFSLFLFLSIGLGGYYFWVTQSESFPQISLPGFLSKDAPTEKIPSFSASNANYLNIDIKKTDKDQIRALVNKYAKEMAGDGITSAVEFIVSDSKNNPIDFSVFGEKMGLSLSQEITSKLDRNFSLFIYNDSNKPRLGLVIAAQEGEELRKALVQEEANLPRELQGIFLAEYSLEAKTFKNSSYSGIGVRYLNITSPEELSIDYTVSGNQFILGTTKMTLRSMIDYLSSSKQFPTTSDAPNPAGLSK